MILQKSKLPVVFGLLWGAIPLSYQLTGSPTGSYILILISYTIAIGLGHLRALPRASIQIVVLIGIFLFLSAIVEIRSVIDLERYLALVLFAINLSVLLALIQPEQTYAFLRVFFKATAACAVLHVVLVFSGQLGDHYGRYLFLGDSHPNLGGEVYAMASFAGAVSSTRKAMLVFSVPLLVSAYLMQSRTGIAVVALTILLRVFVVSRGTVSPRSLVIGIGSAAIVVLVSLLIPQLRDWILNNVVLVDDVDRGLSAGLITGRDQRWVDAMQDFKLSPFVGNGLSWYSDGRTSAHSPFFYSLVYFGAFGLMFWYMILWNIGQMARRNVAAIVLAAPAFLMILLNDRFLNSNAFPLLFYFCILQMSRRETPAMGFVLPIKNLAMSQQHKEDRYGPNGVIV